MTMTRKHFRMIADIVRNKGGENRGALAHAFASELHGENPLFDRQRFLDACTPEEPSGDIITVHGYERLKNSTNGNPRYRLLANGGALVTSSDAACNYDIENGWAGVRGPRFARVTRTKAGRIATLEWLDGDN